MSQLDRMKQAYADTLRHEPWFAQIVQIGDNSSDASLEQMVGYVLNAYREVDDDARRICESGEASFKTVTCSLSGSTGSLSDPTDRCGDLMRDLYPDARILSCLLAIPIEGSDARSFQHCSVIIPHSTTIPRYRRLDHELPGLGAIVDGLAGVVGTDFGRGADVRELLGARGFRRVLTVAAGSQGWDRAGGSESSVGVKSKNSGTLAAVHNDFNSIFGLLTRCSRASLLPGVTATGLVKHVATLRGMLGCLSRCANPECGSDEALLGDIAAASPEWTGNLWYDCTLGLTSDTSVTISGSTFHSTTFGAAVTDEYSKLLPDDVGGETPAGAPSYGMLFYSGHGSKAGNMQLDESEALTPEEVFQLSYESRVPLLVICDMCYSHRFGARYLECCRRHEFPGLVLTATSPDDGSEVAHEADRMETCRRGFYPFVVPEMKASSRGILSSALGVGLLALRDLDMARGQTTRVSIEDFVSEILRPISIQLSEVAEIPHQIPTLYSL